MELLVIFCLAIVVAAGLRLRKTAARKRFVRAADTYDHQRSLRIAAADNPWSIPTVEEFLAARDELHLIAVAGWRSNESPEADRLKSEVADAAESFSSDDDGYEQFVAEMWGKNGVDLLGIILKRETISGQVACYLHSLVEGSNGQVYLNVYENDQKKTYATDGRHKWRRFGDIVDATAFVAIRRGANPDEALRFEQYAGSFDEAVTPEFNRFQTTDKRYVIAYLSDDKGLSYRVVSRVIRSDDRFSARCHFRWGERRTFLFRNLRDVFDLQTRQPIDLPTFLAKR